MTKITVSKLKHVNFYDFNFETVIFLSFFFLQKIIVLKAQLPLGYFQLYFYGCAAIVFFFFRFFRGKLNSRNVYIWQHFDPQENPKCVYMVAF